MTRLQAVILQATGTGLATIVTALTALWTAEGVTTFGDITQVQYAVTFLGGLGVFWASFQTNYLRDLLAGKNGDSGE